MVAMWLGVGTALMVPERRSELGEGWLGMKNLQIETIVLLCGCHDSSPREWNQNDRFAFGWNVVRSGR